MVDNHVVLTLRLIGCSENAHALNYRHLGVQLATPADVYFTKANPNNKANNIAAAPRHSLTIDTLL